MSGSERRGLLGGEMSGLKAGKVAGIAAVLTALAALCLLGMQGTTQGPRSMLEIVDIPTSELSALEKQQLLVALQRDRAQMLGTVWNTDVTDQWIKVAEAIDADAVNDPALPAVDDAIVKEVEIAKSEQDLERDIQSQIAAGQAVASRMQGLRMPYGMAMSRAMPVPRQVVLV